MNNHVAVVGNVTDEPELKFSAAGNPWTTFSIAENSRVKNARGEWEDGDPSYYDIKAFGRIAEKVGENMAKGTRVIVVGKIIQERWESKEGDKRSAVRVIASDVGESFMFAGDGSGSGGGGTPKSKARDAIAAVKAASEEEPF